MTTSRRTTAPLRREGGRTVVQSSWNSRRPRLVSPDQRQQLRTLYKRLYPSASDQRADSAMARRFAAEWGHALSQGSYDEGSEAIAVMRDFVQQAQQQQQEVTP